MALMHTNAPHTFNYSCLTLFLQKKAAKKRLDHRPAPMTLMNTNGHPTA